MKAVMVPARQCYTCQVWVVTAVMLSTCHIITHQVLLLLCCHCVGVSLVQPGQWVLLCCLHASTPGMGRLTRVQPGKGLLCQI